MSKKVIVFDTSILCCYLSVPGKDTCGRRGDRWDKGRVQGLLERESDAIWVLPLATIIETGNHIAQADKLRFETAAEFCKLLAAATNATAPWAAFQEQIELWQPYRVIALADVWPEFAKSGISLGDATIKDVAEYYARSGIEVEILTADAGLKAYQPSVPVIVPRRRG